MRKYIDGIYKKRGCMVGYLIEGMEDDVIKKINKRIVADSNYAQSEILVKKLQNGKYQQYYESNHSNYHGNPLRHFIFDIAILN